MTMVCSVVLQILLLGLPSLNGQDFGNIYEKLGKMCYQDSKNYIRDSGDGLYCNVEFTGTCWPQVKAGFTVMRTCPKLYFKDNALISRHCTKNGVWDTINFSSCVKLSEQEAKEAGLKIAKEIDLTINRSPGNANTKKPEDYQREVYVFVVCSWIAVIVLFFSLVVLSVQKSSNERFSMDRNLVFAFLMRTATFFIDYYTGLSSTANLKGVCNFFWILNRYFAVTEITWMLNEAIYLLRKIRNALDNNSYHLYFVLWGWGLPFVLTFVAYTPFMHYMHINDQRCWTHLGQSLEMLVLYIPLTIMLMINFGIMIYVITVLVSKMREEKFSEARIVWKSAKGALVLMPSLGFIYLVTFYTPVGNVKFDLFVRILYPMQGVLVCIVNVAFNHEIHHELKHRWRKWKAGRFQIDRSKRTLIVKDQRNQVNGQENPALEGGAPNVPRVSPSFTVDLSYPQNKIPLEKQKCLAGRRLISDSEAQSVEICAVNPLCQGSAGASEAELNLPKRLCSTHSSLTDVASHCSGGMSGSESVDEIAKDGPKVITYRKVSTV